MSALIKTKITGTLNADRLAEYGLPENILKSVREGVPADFKFGFQPGKIQLRPNSRAIKRNWQVVSWVVSALVSAGHASPMSERASVISPLINITP